MKLYGVPLSQPFRAVAWTMLQNEAKFEIKITVPGATTKIGSLNELYRAKTKGRLSTVPMLEYPDSFCVAESPAILTSLCERHGWNSFYGAPGTDRKAIIDSYLHWHHTGTRQLYILARPYLRAELGVTINDGDLEKVNKILSALNDGWLEDSDYIAGSQLSIADILAYEEVVQDSMTGLLPQLSEYENVSAWVQRMQKLPYHAEAHKSLSVLGSLAEPSDTPMPKRLSAATKAGIAALNEAQKSFGPSKL